MTSELSPARKRVLERALEHARASWAEAWAEDKRLRDDLELAREDEGASAAAHQAALQALAEVRQEVGFVGFGGELPAVLREADAAVARAREALGEAMRRRQDAALALHPSRLADDVRWDRVVPVGQRVAMWEQRTRSLAALLGRSLPPPAPGRSPGIPGPGGAPGGMVAITAPGVAPWLGPDGRPARLEQVTILVDTATLPPAPPPPPDPPARAAPPEQGRRPDLDRSLSETSPSPDVGAGPPSGPAVEALPGPQRRAWVAALREKLG